MNMEIKKIGRDACRVSSWSGGTTTELSIAPENGNYRSRDFLWRLSSATVELEESTFTPLPDFERIILTLEGEMDICHDGGPWIHLEEFSPHRFDGASETRSRGKVADFNLMLRKGACTGNLEVLSGSGSEQTEDVYRTLFFYCHEGRMEVLVSGPGSVILDEGQGLLLRGLPSGSRIAYEMRPGTRAVKAEIHEKHENDKN